MPSPDRPPDAMREACAATWYGFDAVYRRDDPFESTLQAISTWAASLDGYEAASIDVFTGTDYLTLAGRRQPRPVLDEVHAVVAGDPQCHVHTVPALTRRPGSPAPGGWTGATLLTTNGVVLGSLSLWSTRPVAPQDPTHIRLAVLARATMQTLEERRRVWNGRAAGSPGPRAVTSRRIEPRT